MSIQVLLYHHVNRIDKSLTLNVRPGIFERQMELLARNNYRTVFLDEIISLEKEKKRPDKVVAITFDDGYLDNWVYAYPILKKYGLKATVFVTTANINDSDEARLNIEAIWDKKVKREDLPRIDTHFNVNLDCTPGQPNRRYGFMNWGELRRMQNSGFIDIQSHSHTHGYYYISEKIVGFNRMQSWAVSWPTDGDMRLGIPLYERRPSLIARRYFDDPLLRNVLADFAAASSNSLLRRLNTAAWQRSLYKKAEDFLTSNGSYKYYESQDEYIDRINDELSVSKEKIENRLNKACEYLSYPAGKYNDEVVAQAIRIGYKAAFINNIKPAISDHDSFAAPRAIITGKMDDFIKHLHIGDNANGLEGHGDEKKFYQNYRTVKGLEVLKEKEKKRLEGIIALIPEDAKTIIDCGCGDGRLVNRLRQTNRWELMGLDFCEESLKSVQTQKMCADASDMPFSDGSYDLVICSEVLEHLPAETYKKTVSELTRVSAKYLLISVPYKENRREFDIKCPNCGQVFNAWRHRRAFSLGSLAKPFKNFDVCRFEFTGERLPYFNKFLLFLNQRLGNKWALPDRTTLCPRCSNSRFEKTSGNFISKICERLNFYLQLFVPKRDTRWALVLFKRRPQ